MKDLIILVCLVLALSSCTNKSYRLTGVAGKNAKYVYYTANFFDKNPSLDSVAVKNGQYVIEGEADEAKLISGVVGNNLQFWFVAEPGEIKISKDGVPSGTSQNDSIKAFLEKVNSRELDSKNKSDAFITEFMKNNSNNLAGAFALFMFSDFIGLSKTGEIMNTCGDVVKNIIYKVIPKEEFKNSGKTVEGQMFTDFNVEYDGKIQKLSDYVGKGKYVLVDFWASWCGPCRQEISTIKQIYEQYAGDKFDVVGVATWDKPEDTKQAIKELGIKYPQIINAQSIGSDVYGIEGIPEIILFSPNGKILYRNLRGKQMVKVIENVLK